MLLTSCCRGVEANMHMNLSRRIFLKVTTANGREAVGIVGSEFFACVAFAQNGDNQVVWKSRGFQ